MQESIGSKLREARIASGFSVQEVSEKMMKSGMEKASVKTIYSWESGNSKPSTDYFLELCSIYQIKDISSFFGYKKSLASELPDTRDETEVMQWLIKLLESNGYKNPGDDLTVKESDFLIHLIGLIDAFFDKNG